MKAILTGASGFIGGGVFEECLNHPDITSIVVLCRRPLSGSAASSAKVKVLVVEDFLNYSSPVLDEIKDADFCIWALGHRYSPSENVEVGYTMAFCEAMSRLRSQTPAKPFRMVYLSGIMAITDQSASLWFNDAPRKAKGMAETKLLAFSDSQKQNHDPEWDTYVVRPGGVLTKQWGWITGIFGNSWFIRIDVLARAMVATALNGDSEKRVFHPALVKKGEAELSQAK